ncbi:MlaD family protein [Verrucomicrobia bacterium]|nr:MlaD family protein [Verrucomicrobiota bacterium]
MKNRSNHALVGVFSLGAIVLLLAFAVFTGGFSSLRDENERFVMVFHENVYGLHEGGKVTLNGVRIGRVERFFIGDALDKGPVPVLVEINRKLVLRHMVEQKNEIFDQNGKFKREIIPRLMGQLIQESFVTGILYVNLTTESDPGDDPGNSNMLYGFTEIRTKDSIFAELSESINLEKISKQFSKLMETATDKLEKLDVETLGGDFSAMTVEIQTFLKEFSKAYTPLGPSLTATSGEAKVALAKVAALSDRLKEMLDPDSDFRFGFSDTLREIAGMAKSLKSLADLLERNPQAFLRGKPNAQE